MISESDFDIPDDDFSTLAAETPKHRWVRTLPRGAVATCFVVDMSDTSDVGPEMPLAALCRFHADWIGACIEAETPASTPFLLGASPESGRLRIWIQSMGTSYAAHRNHGSIRSIETGISGRMEGRHSFIDSPALNRLNDEAWARVAGRTRQPFREGAMRLRDRPLTNACYVFTILCWTYLFSVGSIGWPVLLLTTTAPTILMVMRLVESRRAASERMAGRAAESVSKDQEESERPSAASKADPFDAVLSRLDATDRPRAVIAATACRRILVLSADRPELREFADDLMRQTRELVQRHDEAAALLDDDAVLGERLVIGIEALAHQADETRRTMAKGALDGLETHVRYLSARASNDDPLSLPIQQGTP